MRDVVVERSATNMGTACPAVFRGREINIRFVYVVQCVRVARDMVLDRATKTVGRRPGHILEHNGRIVSRQ